MPEPELADPWWRKIAMQMPGIAPVLIVAILAAVIWLAFCIGGVSSAVLVTFVLGFIAIKV